MGLKDYMAPAGRELRTPAFGFELAYFYSFPETSKRLCEANESDTRIILQLVVLNFCWLCFIAYQSLWIIYKYILNIWFVVELFF